MSIWRQRWLVSDYTHSFREMGFLLVYVSLTITVHRRTQFFAVARYVYYSIHSSGMRHLPAPADDWHRFDRVRTLFQKSEFSSPATIYLSSALGRGEVLGNAVVSLIFNFILIVILMSFAWLHPEFFSQFSLTCIISLADCFPGARHPPLQTTSKAPVHIVRGSRKRHKQLSVGLKTSDSGPESKTSIASRDLKLW